MKILTDKQANQDDGETNKGTRGQHNSVCISLAQTFVVQDHTGDGQDLEERKKDDG